jgi:hypothetical protein
MGSNWEIPRPEEEYPQGYPQEIPKRNMGWLLGYPSWRSPWQGNPPRGDSREGSPKDKGDSLRGSISPQGGSPREYPKGLPKGIPEGGLSEGLPTPRGIIPGDPQAPGPRRGNPKEYPQGAPEKDRIEESLTGVHEATRL